MTNTDECLCALCQSGAKVGIMKFIEFLQEIYGRKNVIGCIEDTELVIFIYDHSVSKSILLSFDFDHRMLFANTKDEIIYAWDYSLVPNCFQKYNPEDGSTTNDFLNTVELIELIGDKKSMAY